MENDSWIIQQKYVDHFWQQFQQGRMSGEHEDRKVFAETLQTFARFMFNKPASPG